MGMIFPFPDQFTLKESDVIERMRDKISDLDIVLRWRDSVGKKLIKKPLEEVVKYLLRNPRGKK